MWVPEHLALLAIYLWVIFQQPAQPVWHLDDRVGIVPNRRLGFGRVDPCCNQSAKVALILLLDQALALTHDALLHGVRIVCRSEEERYINVRRLKLYGTVVQPVL